MGPAPAALEVDTVDEDAGVTAPERPLAPFPDGREGLLVEVGDGAGGHRRAPEGLGRVLDPPGGDAREAHLDDGLLDRRLAPAVALDDGGLEGGSPELGHAQLDLARARDEPAGIVTAAVGLAPGGPPVALGADELGRLLVEQRVQGLLDGPPDQIFGVVAQRLLVD